MNDKRVLVRARGEVGRRRRTAPRAEETSDVRRFKGVAIATVVVAAIVALGVLLTSKSEAEYQPGPLARPHLKADVKCEGCHVQDAAPPQRCVGCHGPHPTTRKGHAKVRKSGQMTCVTCHEIHAHNAGVAFGDAIWRYGSGWEETVEDVEVTPGLRGVVPVVRASACGKCHDPGAPRDPIVRCLLAGQEGLEGQRPTVCFDEHRLLSAATLQDENSARDRLPLWEAARAVERAHPEPGAAVVSDDRLPTAFAFLGLFVGLGLVGLWRVASRRPKNAATPPPANALAPPEVRRLPQINTGTCIGCSACVDACPYDVLELRRYIAVVSRPDDCCGLTLCEQRCPNGSLIVTDGEPIEDRPRVDANLESTDVPGVYLAGDLTGLPLIRNAINQGAHAIERVAESLAREGAGPPNVVDVLIVGAGPAGLAAALQAQQKGLSYTVLEQGSVAESIRSFPRGKLVFDQPLGVPLHGDLWLAEATKEELLGKWLRIVRRHGVQVAEGHRVDAIRPGPYFTVDARTQAGPQSFYARRVVLSIGRRGSPRKLPVEIPEGALDRVHYSMADAASFAGQRCVVVGLGDVAMETAIALCRQPGTTVTVSYRGADFRRGKARNIAELRRLAEVGRVQLRFGTTPSEVRPAQLVLGEAEVPYDALFVMIGSIAPWAFLEKIGVKRALAAPVGADGAEDAIRAGATKTLPSTLPAS